MDFNNYAIVTIYNLNRETENKIINESDRLVINAGYEGYLNAVPMIRRHQTRQRGPDQI